MFENLDPSTIHHLLPGRIFIEQDQIPERIGSIFLPGSARKQSEFEHIAHTGVVLAIGYGTLRYKDEADPKRPKNKSVTVSPDDIKVGDRVVFRLLMSDLNSPRIMTDVRRIDAVLAEGSTGNEKI